MLQNLYKVLAARNINGNIKLWLIYKSNVGYHIKYGNLHHSLIELGRVFTAKEIDSKYRKKLKEGYKEISLTDYNNNNYNLPKTNTDANGFLKPVKCQRFVINKFNYPAFAQPKINGLRAFIIWGTIVEGDGMFKTEKEQAVILSKEGNRYVLPEIERAFTKDMFNNVDAYDGELYVPGYKLNQVKKCIPIINYKGTLSKVSGDPSLVSFWMFDVAMDNIIQRDRLDRIIHFDKLDNDIYYFNVERNTMFDIMGTKIVSVLSKIVYSDEMAIQYTNMCINAGFEGSVIRDMDAEYAFGSRPKTMMKIKNFIDAEFEIIDIIPKPHEPSSALFICRNDINDTTFKVNPMGTLSKRKEYLANKDKYIGKKATIKYYERSGVKDVPLHASLVTIRDYE